MYKIRGKEYDGNTPLTEVVKDLEQRGQFQAFADRVKRIPKEEVEVSAQELIESLE